MGTRERPIGCWRKVRAISAWQRAQAASPRYLTSDRVFPYGETGSVRRLPLIVTELRHERTTNGTATARTLVRNRIRCFRSLPDCDPDSLAGSMCVS